MSEGQPAPKRSSGTALAWLYRVGLSVAVYVLSIGPAALLAKHYRAAEPVLETIYAPIVFLCDRCPALQTVVLGYLELWGVPTQVPVYK
jgi:hypothetical protein